MENNQSTQISSKTSSKVSNKKKYIIYGSIIILFLIIISLLIYFIIMYKKEVNKTESNKNKSCKITNETLKRLENIQNNIIATTIPAVLGTKIQDGVDTIKVGEYMDDSIKLVSQNKLTQLYIENNDIFHTTTVKNKNNETMVLPIPSSMLDYMAMKEIEKYKNKNISYINYIGIVNEKGINVLYIITKNGFYEKIDLSNFPNPYIKLSDYGILILMNDNCPIDIFRMYTIGTYVDAASVTRSKIICE